MIRFVFQEDDTGSVWKKEEKTDGHEIWQKATAVIQGRHEGT